MEMVDWWNIEIIHQEKAREEVKSDDDEHIDQCIHISMTMEYLPLFDCLSILSSQPIILLDFH